MAKKKASLGCLFWLALVLLVAVVFLFNRRVVARVMQETGFLSLLSPRNREEPPRVAIEEIDDAQGTNNEKQEEPRQETVTVTPATQSRGDSTETTPESRTKTELPVREPPPSTPAKSSGNDSSANKPHLRRGRLYFVTVDEQGKISLTGMVRSIRYDDAPLAETLDLLLQGPSTSEAAQGYISLIPAGAKITNLYVKGGTAYISFNENFRFNPFGREGLDAQLRQVVYTATDFHNIDRVQILIEGKKRRYLGPEGIDISKPLSKDSFRQGPF